MCGGFTGEHEMNNDFIFEFLDDLRDSGKMNMFGAPKVLIEHFDFSKKEAKEIFFQWMQR